jgi:hypothetical protein
MYLLEFDENGVLYKITPNAELGLIGIYVDKIPLSTEELLVTFNEMELENKKYYIKKENE